MSKLTFIPLAVISQKSNLIRLIFEPTSICGRYKKLKLKKNAFRSWSVIAVDSRPTWVNEGIESCFHTSGSIRGHPVLNEKIAV